MVSWFLIGSLHIFLQTFFNGKQFLDLFGALGFELSMFVCQFLHLKLKFFLVVAKLLHLFLKAKLLIVNSLDKCYKFFLLSC